MMMRNKIISILALLLFSGSAWADPFTFTVLNGSGNGGTYSLVHDNAGPSGGNHRNFLDNQNFWGDLTASLLDTSGYGDQFFDLDNGQTFILHSLTLDLDGMYGLAGADGDWVGSIAYSIVGAGDVEVYSSVFDVYNTGYTALFNQSYMSDGLFFAALWAGDGEYNLGIDFVFDGTSKVPEPGTLILMGIGLLGLGFSRDFKGRDKRQRVTG